MKKAKKILVVVSMCAFAATLVQSCASSKSKYGCPERMNTEFKLMP